MLLIQYTFYFSAPFSSVISAHNICAISVYKSIKCTDLLDRWEKIYMIVFSRFGNPKMINWRRWVLHVIFFLLVFHFCLFFGYFQRIFLLDKWYKWNKQLLYILGRGIELTRQPVSYFRDTSLPKQKQSSGSKHWLSL